MDFFARQEKTRRNTAALLVYFFAAIIGTAALVYFVFRLFLFFLVQQSRSGQDLATGFAWWDTDLFLMVFFVTLGLIGIASIVKIIELRSGGGAGVAELMGGRRIDPNADDFYERRLLNIVEEIAIAAGMTVPPVYVLRSEEGINAFAAGYTPRDAVVAVTLGAMTVLTRDELQGVIAHEFSHIANGDMRLNIHLMGNLYGLLVITLIGRGILRSRVRGKSAAYVYLIGLALLIIGAIGLFFGKLIKSAISRQREFLADASAVQFTRNPAGLAGALKKIGGLLSGSRISTSQAEEASHMFFSDGLRSSLFATHPPLAERIRWLEPSFTGKFERVMPESLSQALAASEGAPSQQKSRSAFTSVSVVAAGAVLQKTKREPPPAAPSNPDKLMATIGAPLQQHVQAAGQLIESIPAELKAQARDPYGARAVIYLLLLDGDDTVRTNQLNLLRGKIENEVFTELTKLIPLLDQIFPEMRLPLCGLAVPALRMLSPNQYLPFRAGLRALIEADQRVNVFEYALERILICRLDPLFAGAKRMRAAGYYAFCGVQNEISCVLSVFARLNSDASAAFQKAAGNIPDNRAQFALQPEAECNWEKLDAALDKLAGASFYIKKWVLASALVCLMHDREVVIEEIELFRAVADSLDCPVPPWLTVTKV
ncbi:MAG: M48 family metallopeptidase [Kiritimatiellales bacterium]|jgi:Zn-dependent protease with chaperone function